MAIPEDLTEALALLTPSSASDRITGTELRDVLRWLATPQAAGRLALPAIYTGGAATAPAIGSWFRYNLSGGAGTLTLPDVAESAGLGIVLSEVGGLTTALTVDGDGADIRDSSGALSGTVDLDTAYAQSAILSDGVLWELRGNGAATPATLEDWTVTAIKTGAYNANIGEWVRCNPTGGAFAVTLPAAAGNTGRKVAVKNVSDSATAITVEGTIDGVVDPTIASPRGSMVVVSNGTDWMQV